MASRLISKEKPDVQARALRTNGSTNTEIECLPWITRSGGKHQVSTPKPLQRSTHASSKFLNFVTVLGPSGQGKSFLLNCLLGKNVLPTSNKVGVCTKGVQLASAVHEVGNGGLAFFVDTEGQGDERDESDTTLLTPILLLSKVILFNWNGGLQYGDILDELAILVEVGNSVSSESFGESKKFGHLHILLRDCDFGGTAKEARATILDEENSSGKKVKERNEIRQKLLSSFESIDVFIIPVPCEDFQNLDPVDTSDEFQESVKKLKDAILGQMSQPRRFGSVVVSSQNVDPLLKKFVKELEDGDIVHVKSVISQLQREVVDEAKRKFEESLIQAYKEIEVPVKDGLEELLIQMRDLDVFRKSTAEVDLEAAYRDDVLEGLQSFADRELDEKKNENRKREHNISRERGMVQEPEQLLPVQGAQSSPLSSPDSSPSSTPSTPPPAQESKFYKGGKRIQREVVDEAKRKFEESLKEAYRKAHAPVKDGLRKLLIQIRNAHLDVFRKSTAEVDLEVVYRDDVLEGLERFADREFDAKQRNLMKYKGGQFIPGGKLAPQGGCWC